MLDQMVTAMTRMLAVVFAAGLLGATPAFAQVDLSGTWANRLHEDWIERAPGPDIGDYTGVPLNDEGRARADAYQVSLQAMPERQCILYTAQYMVMGPQNLRISADVDPISGRVVAWRFSGTVDRAPHTIWMDGRPQPSKNAPHTAGGFSTGEWQGNTLVAHTTHLTDDMVWRNGVQASDQATMTETYVRHDNTLTITMILDDPIYFDEPFIRSASFVLDPVIRVLPEPCEPQVEITRKEGEVPHYLPGANPFLKELSDAYKVPYEAVRGGGQTLYPEYRKKLKDIYAPPAMCTKNCCAGVGGGVADRDQNCAKADPATKPAAPQ